MRVSFLWGLFCGGLRFTLASAIVILIDLWSGLSVTLSVADAQMIGAIYGVKQTLRRVCFRPQPGEASPLVAGFPFMGASGSVYARCVGGRLFSVCRSALFERRMGEAERCYCNDKARVTIVAVRSGVRALLLGLCVSGRARYSGRVGEKRNGGVLWDS